MADTAPTTSEAAPAGAIQKPKRAVSAYWLFLSKMREEVAQELKQQGGKASLGDIAKATAAKWAALGEAERKEFEDKAAEDKQRYAEEFKAYLEASDPAGTLRNKYADMIPKKPMTAYFLFSQDPAQREKAAAALKDAGAEAAVKQLAAKLAEMWKGLSSEEKAPFEEKHRQEQSEFLRKQKEWQATPEFAEIEAAAKKQAEQQKADGQEGQEPKAAKRSRSAAKAASPKETAKRGAQESPVSTAKRPKRAAHAKDEEAAAIDKDVLAEAGKAGLEGALRNLASRPEVAACGKSAHELLKALQASGGLVNPAKRALLASAGA